MYSITSRLSILRTEFIFNEKLKCQKIQKMQLPDIDFYHTVILLLWVKKWDMLYAWRIFLMLLTTLPHCGPRQLFIPNTVPAVGINHVIYLCLPLYWPYFRNHIVQNKCLNKLEHVIPHYLAVLQAKKLRVQAPRIYWIVGLVKVVGDVGGVVGEGGVVGDV